MGYVKTAAPTAGWGDRNADNPRDARPSAVPLAIRIIVLGTKGDEI